MRRVLKLSMMVLFVGVLVAGLTGCSEKAEKAATAADGLDLYTVASLVKSGRAKNAEELRTYLACGQGYNNLDLDSDGFCEDVNVTEYGNLSAFGFGSVRGYSLSVQMSNGSIQEIARLQIRNDTSGVVMSVIGNEQIYGLGHNFDTRLASNVNAVPFLVWAFTPSRTVVYAPGYVVVVPEQRRRVIAVTEYRTVTKRVVKEVPMEMKQTARPSVQTDVVSPNAGKSSDVIKAPLKAPSEVQQQFQARPENKPVAVGGFGKKQDAPAVVTTPATETVPKKLPTIGDKKDLPATPGTAQPLDKSDPKNVQQKFEQRDPAKDATAGQFGKPKPEYVPKTLPGTTLPTPKVGDKPALVTPSIPSQAIPPGGLPKIGERREEKKTPTSETPAKLPSSLPTIKSKEEPRKETPKTPPAALPSRK